MKETNKKYFLAANSCHGFVSEFLSNCNEDYKTYIIKGGPGTGKSSFMKKVAAFAAAKGDNVIYCPCSSDPKSLDAVIIPSLKVSIADGTAPHVLEPKYPGISEKLIDLGAFRDDDILIKNRDRIIELTKANAEQHKSCTAFLSAARSAANDNTAVALSALRIARVHKFAEKLAEALSVFGKPVTACGSVAEGVRTAIAQAEQGEAIVAFGSLYMVGDIRQTAME